MDNLNLIPGEQKIFTRTPKNIAANNIFKTNDKNLQKRLTHLCNFIDENCSEFLGYAKQTKKLLYRGIKDKTAGNIFLGYSRNNRHPKDTNSTIQKLVDEYLTIGGFNALRSNSIFCIGDPNDTSVYGKPFLIFPINGFDYLWSIDHYDWVIYPATLSPNFLELGQLFSDIRRYFNHSAQYDAVSGDFKNFWYSGPIYNLLNDFMNTSDGENYIFQLEQLQKLFSDIETKYSESGPAITKFLESNMYFKSVNMINNSLDPNIASKEFIQFNKITNTHFETALKLNHEILIHGKYVAVNYEMFYRYLKNYFLD